jgi:hypothetical protein
MNRLTRLTFSSTSVGLRYEMSQVLSDGASTSAVSLSFKEK